MKNLNKKLVTVLSSLIILTTPTTITHAQDNKVKESVINEGRVKEHILNKVKDFDVEKLPVLKKEKNKDPEAYQLVVTSTKSDEKKKNEYNDVEEVKTQETIEYRYINALQDKIGTQKETEDELILSNDEFAKIYDKKNGFDEGKKIKSNNKQVIDTINEEMRKLAPAIEKVDVKNYGFGLGEWVENELNSENYKDLLQPHMSEDELNKINKDTVKGEVRFHVYVNEEGEIYQFTMNTEYEYTDKDELVHKGFYSIGLNKPSVELESITEAKK